jgi:hypothetical protein
MPWCVVCLAFRIPLKHQPKLLPLRSVSADPLENRMKNPKIFLTFLSRTNRTHLLSTEVSGPFVQPD